jgi:hypothetical protein
MSVSTEVKRTLVKSPPELWSELSDPQSLARHMGDLEDVRIVSSEPESTLEWEAQNASGSVLLEPTGFGTKVVLSLTRKSPQASATVELEPDGDEHGAGAPESQLAEATSEPQLAEPTPEPPPAEPEASISEPQTYAVELEPIVEQEIETDEQEPALAQPVPERKPGFFARLFRRRRAERDEATGQGLLQEQELLEEPGAPAIPELTTKPEPEPGMIAPEEPEQTAAIPERRPEPEPTFETIASVEPEPAASIESIDSQPQDTSDVSADLATLEAEMEEQDAALLTAALDRLGAAHHRPFSRG